MPDNWLIPARAYLDAPPEPVAGFAIVRNADQTAWEAGRGPPGTGVREGHRRSLDLFGAWAAA
ncbi:hypothetical protein PPS11_40380 [Pseudomonas putida S11]|nr:hypothetical protein PPS11_40380 [Pseudomonas putida S11]